MKPLKYNEFECQGHGLTYLGYRRTNSLALKNALGIGPRLRAKRHPIEWWQAQVRLYGLECSQRSLKPMKDAIRKALENGPLKVPTELQHIEKKLNCEYKTLEEEARVKRREEFKEMKGKYPEEMEDTWDVQSELSIAEPTPKNNFDSELALRRSAEIDRLHTKLVKAGTVGTDISGLWYFNCPELLDWSADGRDKAVVWKIHAPQSLDRCVWVSMQQNIVEGILRIEWNDPERLVNQEQKFTWRGRETGEGECQWNDQNNHGTITFQSCHECSGSFNCEYGGPWEFRGKKVSKEIPPGTMSIDACRNEFKKFTERRWNRENIQRWGGWGGYSDDDSKSEISEGDTAIAL